MEEIETLRNEGQTKAISQQETEVKLDSYMRDYERYFEENKRLRELLNQVRDEKESALSEVNRLKIVFSARLNEVNDECNVKVAHLENLNLESRERHKGYEEKAYAVMIKQEQIAEKWKDEHKNTVAYYDRSLKALQIENRHLSDKVVELRGQVRAMRADPVHERPKMGSASSGSALRNGSKSKERK